MRPHVDIVVKCGGGLLADSTAFSGVMAVLKAASRGRSVLIVPGGGPFADAVRALVHPLDLSSDVAHWMAIRAMDVYACLLADRLDGDIVADAADLATTREHQPCRVLAPYQWLRAEDPLPHTWDVTSDSIAAWVAGRLQAARLVLIKPPGASGVLVDAHFARVLPSGVEAVTVCADRLDDVRLAFDLAAEQTPRMPAQPD